MLNDLVELQETKRKAFDIITYQALNTVANFNKKVRGKPFYLHDIIFYWDPKNY